MLTTEDFIRLYPNTTNKDLAELFCSTEGAVSTRGLRLGLRKTKEHRGAQTRLHQSGKPKTEAQREASKAALPRGPNHPRWTGGEGQWKRFVTPAYKEWREAVLERDKYTCQDCLRRCAKHERGLAAHHIQPWALFPDLRYTVSNGRTLCRDCHRKLHRNPLKPVAPVPCACGCGELIRPFTVYGQPRRFARWHQNKGLRKGHTNSPEHNQKIRDAMLRIGHKPPSRKGVKGPAH